MGFLLKISSKDFEIILLLLALFSLIVLFFWPQEIVYNRVGLAQTFVSRDGEYIEFVAEVESYQEEGEVLRVCRARDCLNVHIQGITSGDFVCLDPKSIGEEVLIRGELREYRSRRYLDAHQVWRYG